MPRPDPAAAGPTRKPIPWAFVPILASMVLFAPAFLGLDAYSTFFLRGDDFVYLAEASDWSELSSNLFRPHNAHVVPLFRLWFYGVAQAAGSYAALPTACLAASYVGFIVALLGVGHLVAWESRRLGWGLAAIAGAGMASVPIPTVAWFSAGQAMLSGAFALSALQAAQLARIDSRRLWIVLATSACAAAPWIWSGGYVAGPACFVYLQLDGRREMRRASWLPAAASCAVFLASVGITGFSALGSGSEAGFRPIAGLMHTSQAIPEFAVLANLGLDGTTTPTQGLALTMAIIGIWGWSRGMRFRPTPLEGAGAVLILGGYGLAYAFRGSFPFESLRDISWYQAIPHLGAALFVGGWATHLLDPDVRPGPPRRFSRRFSLGLLAFLGFAVLIQSPRVERRFLESVPPLSASEAERFPTRELRRLRALYLASERRARQDRFLARVDRLQVAAGGLTAADLRRAFGRRLGPGMPEHVAEVDLFDLLSPPSSPAQAVPLSSSIRERLEALITPEPVTRPTWLAPGEPWTPREW
ncbi:MAG: hypothetical protein SFX72_12970 [Isosphaeraceae bacterium]|nr:hypothetical protein [Isosphaeraceae bacterium]